MPTLEQQRLVIRVAYAGAPLAGKTESIRALVRQLRGESHRVYSPSEARGRTVFFDWADYEAGSFQGHPISCQITSVPGQAVLSARREQLLKAADAVILVIDSSAESVADARSCYEEMAPWLLAAGKEAPVGVILQCNKQDLPGALTPEQLFQRLDLPVHGQAHATSALTGKGLRIAFIAAVRLAIERARVLLDRGLLPVGEATIKSGPELLESLQQATTEGALRISHDPALASEPAPQWNTLDSVPVPTRAAESVPAPAAHAAAPASVNAQPERVASAPPPPRKSSWTIGQPRPAVMPASAWTAQTTSVSVTKTVPDTTEPHPGTTTVSAKAPTSTSAAEPPRLPARDLREDEVWPYPLWRALESQLAKDPRALPDSRGGWHGEPIAGWYAHTFDKALDPAAARSLFDGIVARTTDLDRYLSKQRCLALTRQGDKCWVWQIVRRLPTLAVRLHQSLASGTAPAKVADGLIDAALSYLRALEILSSAPERLPLGLGKIGTQDGELVYVGLLPQVRHHRSKMYDDRGAALEVAFREKLPDTRARQIDVASVLSELQSRATGRLPAPVVEMMCSLLIGH